jgi:hypothetical protein
MSQDKAPGPDGFTGHFFKFCWTLIRSDIMAAIDSIYNCRSQDLNLLNKANIVLIPEKEGVESIGDYRSISLIHGIAKILTKVLALLQRRAVRLAATRRRRRHGRLRPPGPRAAPGEQLLGRQRALPSGKGLTLPHGL